MQFGIFSVGDVTPDPTTGRAPTEAASPTRKVFQLSWVANAAAKRGANVETEPSISPARPGWT